MKDSPTPPEIHSDSSVSGQLILWPGRGLNRVKRDSDKKNVIQTQRNHGDGDGVTALMWNQGTIGDIGDEEYKYLRVADGDIQHQRQPRPYDGLLDDGYWINLPQSYVDSVFHAPNLEVKQRFTSPQSSQLVLWNDRGNAFDGKKDIEKDENQSEANGVDGMMLD